MVSRSSEPLLARLARLFPVVAVEGARRVGKTTLVQQYAEARGFADRLYTLDDLATLEAARRDPVAFVEGLTTPAVIDEVQRAPELLLWSWAAESAGRLGVLLHAGRQAHALDERVAALPLGAVV